MYNESYLAHHGVKGQKWGVRRYQNEDGSLNARGIKRYSGKHGATKYVIDTNKALIETNKKRSIRNRAWQAADAGLYGYMGNLATRPGASITERLRNITVGAIIGASLGEVASAGQRIVDEGSDIRMLENNPAMVREINSARRYLRSQGIDV